MTTLTQCHTQWASRPDDERYVNLDDMAADMQAARKIADVGTVMNRNLLVQPIEFSNEEAGIAVTDGQDLPSLPTHWAFGQLCSLVGAPAGYLRTLPPDIASDCLNQSMLSRKVDQVGFLRSRATTDWTQAQAYTGPQYGRIWNADIVTALRSRFGNGTDGDFRIPGEFGRAVAPSKDNTTLFASDRDMFVFLADEENRVDIPNRRGGQPGQLARGFFVSNSEVGAASLRIGTFLFDYVCQNRIVWGAENYQEIAIRHSSRAPMRWINEVMPAVERLKNMSMFSIRDAVTEAQNRYMHKDEVDKVLAKRFTTNQAKAIKLAHQVDEQRPIETAWDIVTGATAYARGLKHQDARIDIERAAGSILSAVQ